MQTVVQQQWHNITCVGLLTDAALLITTTSASVSALEPLSSPSASSLARFEDFRTSCNRQVLCCAFLCMKTGQDQHQAERIVKII